MKRTPLLIAVDTGFHSLVELLVRNESRQEQEDSALREAVESRRLDMVDVLVENGARGSRPFPWKTFCSRGTAL